MTAVWYLGAGDRSITAAQWTAAGISGTPADTVWNAGNGWSVPAAGLTGPQIAILAADGGFNTTAADGPRAGSVITPNPPSANPATQGYVSSYVDPKILELKLSSSPIRRQTRHERRLGPVTTDITSVAETGVFDGTLTKSYVLPVSGISNGQTRALTDAEVAAFPADLGEGVTPSVLNTSGIGYAVPTLPVNFNATPRSYVFMTDAAKVQVSMWANLTSICSYQVFVDDSPVALNPIVHTNGVAYLTITFPSALVRKVEIKSDAMISFMACGPLYTIWKPSPKKSPKVMVVGDSLTSAFVWTAAGAQDLSANGCYQGLAEHINVDSILIDGVSGTGILQRASGQAGAPNNNYADRIATVSGYNPDVLIIHGGGANDLNAGGYSVSAISTAFIAYINAVRAACPSTRIIFVEGMANTSTFAGNTGNYTSIRQNVQAACLAAGVYYIDVATTSPWIAGTGHLPGGTTGNGNADMYVGSDSVHPTTLGAYYLRRRIAPKVQRILQDDGRLVNTLVA